MALLDPLSLPHCLADPAAAGALLAALASEPSEVLAFAYLAADQRLLGLRHSASGCATHHRVPIRAVAADALAFDAAAVVMAHNHPSGDPTPSQADRDATRRLARALELFDMRLLDHLVVARGGTTSFRRLGLL